jgi:hypothetical protein
VLNQGIEFYGNPYCDSPYDDGKTFVKESLRIPYAGDDSFDSNIVLSNLESEMV